MIDLHTLMEHNYTQGTRHGKLDEVRTFIATAEMAALFLKEDGLFIAGPNGAYTKDELIKALDQFLTAHPHMRSSAP